jgi:peptidoglycan/LPS O-acetylase OafA/YrhL
VKRTLVLLAGTAVVALLAAELISRLLELPADRALRRSRTSIEARWQDCDGIQIAFRAKPEPVS